MSNTTLLEAIELREREKLAKTHPAGPTPFYTHYRAIVSEDAVRQELERNAQDVFARERPAGLVPRPGVSREREYKVRKEEHYKIQRQYLQEASWYADAYRIKEGFKKDDQALTGGKYIPSKSDRMGALGEYMVVFFDRMRGGERTYSDYQQFAEAKAVNAQAGDFWFATDPANPPKTNQHYTAFFTELLQAIPVNKRGNEADFCAAFLSQHLVDTNNVMSFWLSVVINDPVQRQAFATALGKPLAEVNARTLPSLLSNPANRDQITGYITGIANQIQNAQLMLEFTKSLSGWRAFLNPDHLFYDRRDALFTALGVTAATITNDQDLYKAMIDALADNGKRAALTKFIEGTTPGYPNGYPTTIVLSEDETRNQEFRNELEKELNIISNSRRLYIYADASYDYPLAGEDKLTNNANYRQLKTSVSARGADYAAAITRYEARIQANQNYRTGIPIDQDSVKVKIGEDLYADADVLGLTRPPRLDPGDPADVNNAKYASFAQDVINSAFPATADPATGRVAVAISANPNKFAAAFLIGTRNTAWADALLADAPTRDALIAVLNGIPVLVLPNVVTAANLTKELLFEYLWINRQDANLQQFFVNGIPPAFAEIVTAQRAFGRISGIANDRDVTKYRDILALDREINNSVAEKPTVTTFKEDHKKKVDRIDTSLDHTTKKNRIDELLLLNTIAIEQIYAELHAPFNPPTWMTQPENRWMIPGAEADHQQALYDRAEELVLNASELRSIKLGGRFIRAGQKTLGSILSNVFGPWSHPSNFAHKTKDGDIWGPTVTRMESGMTTFYAVVQAPGGQKRYKLVDAYDVDDFFSPLGSTFTNFFLKNSQVDKDAIFAATWKRHQFIMENNGLIRATKKNGDPDDLGRFTTHRSAYYTSISAYNQILNGHNAKNMFGNVFVLLYLGVPLFALSLAFVGLSWIVTGIYSLLGGGSWEQPGLAKNLLYSSVKDNPFTWLTKRLWTSPHQEAEIGLARQTADLFIEQKMGELFSDFYVMSTSAKEFETQIKATPTTSEKPTAQNKANEMLDDFEKEFQDKVDEILDDIHIRGGDREAHRKEAEETVLMQEIKLTPTQREHWERQVIKYKEENDKKATNNAPDAGDVNRGRIIPNPAANPRM